MSVVIAAPYHEGVHRSSLALTLLLTACAGSETDRPAASTKSEPEKAPTAAEPEPETEPDKPVELLTEEAPNECVASCIEANIAMAKAAEAIEADCRAKCSAPEG